MPATLNNNENKINFSIMDVILYLLAGSSMAIISVSFLLWLRF